MEPLASLGCPGGLGDIACGLSATVVLQRCVEIGACRVVMFVASVVWFRTTLREFSASRHVCFV